MGEEAALLNARADCLALALDLEEAAAALRALALGRAGPGDVAFIRGLLDNHGDLVVRGQLAWNLLFAHADNPEPTP